MITLPNLDFTQADLLARFNAWYDTAALEHANDPERLTRLAYIRGAYRGIEMIQENRELDETTPLP